MTDEAVTEEPDPAATEAAPEIQPIIPVQPDVDEPQAETPDSLDSDPVPSTEDIFGIDEEPVREPDLSDALDSSTDDLFGESEAPAPDAMDEPDLFDDPAAPSLTDDDPADIFSDPQPPVRSDDDLFGTPGDDAPSLSDDDIFGTPAQPADSLDDDLFGTPDQPLNEPDDDLFSDPIAPSDQPATNLDDEDDLFGTPSIPSVDDEDDLFGTPAALDGDDDLFGTPAASDDDPFDLFGYDAPRTWHDNTGTFQVEARLAEIHPNHVRLLKANGKYCQVPLRRLCNEDRDFVELVASILPSGSVKMVSIDKAAK